MTFSNIRLSSTIPLGYIPPAFPSLYWPINPHPTAPRYLYYPTDIWKFTLFWTLISHAVCFGIVGVWGWALAKNWLWGAGWFFAALIVGGIEAVIGGSVVGLILAAVYNAGYFRMSTWIPFVWGVINMLVLILSSFSLQGGL
ncbi:hypothetical protein BDZ91DRAFT_807412 [Kalaharituber pfeilii]|nr:hypothetical protein BDZ91DRAFT_807412 [Kalaharituber pfeilii]